MSKELNGGGKNRRKIWSGRKDSNKLIKNLK